MSRQNRQKRAAKSRERRRGPAAPKGSFGAAGDGTTESADFWARQRGPSSAELAQLVLNAARARLAAPSRLAASRDGAAELLGEGLAAAPRALATGAGMALAEVVGQLWQHGWLPADLWEITRRRADDGGETSLLVDTIAADLAQYGAGTVEERWAAQVRSLDATVWWQRDQPHLTQWARANGVDLAQAVAVAVDLLAALLPLPRLPVIVPPPGKAAQTRPGAASTVDPKMLTRVRGLLAKAESTEFPDEAEALSAKAQELMNRYAFERATLDAAAGRQQAASSTRLWLDAPYVDAKAHVVSVVADANRCRSVFYPKLGFVALVGDDLDLEITELLVLSLLVQATRAMVAEGSQVSRTGSSRTRSFRHSFLIAYATRIGERLDEAGVRARDAAGDDRLLPVLAQRSKVVDETVHDLFGAGLVHKSTSVSNGAGWQAGRAAADHADLSIDREAIRA